MENQLKQMAELNRRHQKGMSPFVKLDAGDVETNTQAFNHSMGMHEDVNRDTIAQVLNAHMDEIKAAGDNIAELREIVDNILSNDSTVKSTKAAELAKSIFKNAPDKRYRTVLDTYMKTVKKENVSKYDDSIEEGLNPFDASKYRYQIIYDLRGRGHTYGATNDKNEAISIAMDCYNHWMSQPWEDVDEKQEVADSVTVWDNYNDIEFDWRLQEGLETDTDSRISHMQDRFGELMTKIEELAITTGPVVARAKEAADAYRMGNWDKAEELLTDAEIQLKENEDFYNI